VDLYLLDLRKSIKDPLINNNTIKVNIIAVKFFPKTRIADNWINNYIIEQVIENVLIFVKI